MDGAHLRYSRSTSGLFEGSLPAGIVRRQGLSHQESQHQICSTAQGCEGICTHSIVIANAYGPDHLDSNEAQQALLMVNGTGCCLPAGSSEAWSR